jgi:Na+/melibiose symporter-like transporter
MIFINNYFVTVVFKTSKLILWLTILLSSILSIVMLFYTQKCKNHEILNNLICCVNLSSVIALIIMIFQKNESGWYAVMLLVLNYFAVGLISLVLLFLTTKYYIKKKYLNKHDKQL